MAKILGSTSNDIIYTHIEIEHNADGTHNYPDYPESGSKLLWYQASAPTGWTIDATNNDKALRVVSGTGGVTSGTNSFSSILTDEVTVDIETSHTHSTPSHIHPFATSGVVKQNDLDPRIRSVMVDSGFVKAIGGPGSDTSYPALTDDTTSSGSSTSGGGTDHSHTKTFAIQYMDVIVCTKD